MEEFITAAKQDIDNILNFIEVPDNTIPLFDDVYLELDTNIADKLTKIY